MGFVFSLAADELIIHEYDQFNLSKMHHNIHTNIDCNLSSCLSSSSLVARGPFMIHESQTTIMTAITKTNH